VALGPTSGEERTRRWGQNPGLKLGEEDKSVGAVSKGHSSKPLFEKLPRASVQHGQMVQLLS
jgi:hypothetical protein